MLSLLILLNCRYRKHAKKKSEVCLLKNIAQCQLGEKVWTGGREQGEK
jgi:hypothetical protein